MSSIRIMSYVDKSNISEADALSAALSMVNMHDRINESTRGDTNVTKLYYITPVLGHIMVVVSDEDKEILGVNSNLLSNVLISQYPLVKLPASIIEYKELLVNVGSNISEDNILNVAQNMADSPDLDEHKVPIIKIINYNDELPSKLITHSIYGSNIPQVGSGDTTTIISNQGNPLVGKDVLDSLGFDITVFDSLGVRGVNVFFIGPDGNDANDGSYDAPFATLDAVPHYTTVVIKNGLYNKMAAIDSNTESNEIFNSDVQKDDVTMIGEDRSKVIIAMRQTDRRDMPVLTIKSRSMSLQNVTIEYNTTGIATAYSSSIVKSTGAPTLHNVIFNITGIYSMNYGQAVPTYRACQFNGGTKLGNYQNVTTAISPTSPISADPF